ncbi:MAG: transketolase [Candidatus Kapaibacterium sp.]|nr:MAG: transketolase [Candidatus Kapabacteria bacterium]
MKTSSSKTSPSAASTTAPNGAKSNANGNASHKQSSQSQSSQSPSSQNGTKATARAGSSNATLKALGLSREDVLRDYATGWESRAASLMGRREALSGNAKFGIFGDGKEVPQLAMARFFENGDFRSGYYRDQTFMMAIGGTTVRQMFAQLYAHTDLDHEPATAGRTMNAHFATRSLDENGKWKNLTEMKNSSADISPTAAQMPRLVGLAYASRLYREIGDLHAMTQFSRKGNEVAFGTIGNGSCAEGVFWEAVNAIGVLKAPAVISIWDDGYGISVPNKFQMTKENMFELLSGFQRKDGDETGYNVYQVKGWDYPALIETYRKAVSETRKHHIPALIHVVELTQPQGHSTSGSHERYKSKERLEWEREHDCLLAMREWLLESGIATAQELDAIEAQGKQSAEEARKQAFDAYLSPIFADVEEGIAFFEQIATHSVNAEAIRKIITDLRAIKMPERKDVMSAVSWVLFTVRNENIPSKQALLEWRYKHEDLNIDRYNSNLYNDTDDSPLKAPVIPAVYADDAPMKSGFEILNACFDAAFKRDARIVAFGEDVGYLGDVNQAFSGLQKKFGELRVSDTGIREATILGQGIGLAMRGLRPIAEIQYLDYLLYALQIMSDDLACLQYRTKGGQKAPVIIRTRGHRLEGVWHSGSPMSGIVSFVRGIHVLVPRNMVQAAGFYNTLLRSEGDPALVIEVLNGYRLKEKMPANIDEYTLPLGVPEILREGEDITIVSYGATLRLAMKAAEMLADAGIRAEVIDVQSLLPFDRFGMIGKSLQKTNRILFVDEDVPGGCTAYMMQHVLENQGGYKWLDAAPRTLTGKENRPAYGTDGNYWCKPDVEHVFMAAYEIMHEAHPAAFPMFF